MSLFNSVHRVSNRGSQMRNEIREQPSRWTSVADVQSDAFQRVSAKMIQEPSQMVYISGRGSSAHAAQYGQLLFREIQGVIPVIIEPGSIFPSTRKPEANPPIFIAISQSGESPDLIRTAQSAWDCGFTTVAICNAPDSRLSETCEHFIKLNAGHEIAVPATKTFTLECICLFLIRSLAIGYSWEETQRLIDALALASEELRDQLSDSIIARYASALSIDSVFVCGSGFSAPIAKEVALKFLETSHIPATGWGLADALHGPTANLNSSSLVIPLQGTHAFEADWSTFGQRVENSGALVLDFGPPMRRMRIGVRLETESSPLVQWELLPILQIELLQRLSVEFSVASGLNPDAPPGLSKVTETS